MLSKKSLIILCSCFCLHLSAQDSHNAEMDESKHVVSARASVIVAPVMANDVYNAGNKVLYYFGLHLGVKDFRLSGLFHADQIPDPNRKSALIDLGYKIAIIKGFCIVPQLGYGSGQKVLRESYLYNGTGPTLIRETVVKTQGFHMRSDLLYAPATGIVSVGAVTQYYDKSWSFGIELQIGMFEYQGRRLFD